MPLIGGRIVINPMRRAKGHSAVGAADEIDVGPVVIAGRAHARAHVNVVVSRAAGAVNRQEYLTCQSYGINIAAHQAAAEVDCCRLVERRRHIRVLRVGRADAPKAAPAISAANEKIAVGGNVQCSPMGRVRQTKRTLPGGSTVCGAIEQPASTGGSRAPSLVLEAVTGAVGLIDGKPFLVPCTRVSVRLQFQPGLTAICGAIDVVAKCLQQAEVEKRPCLVGVQDRVAAEDIIFQHARERPVHAAIAAIAPAALAEVG